MKTNESIFLEKKFDVWKTIKIGNYNSIDTLCRDLKCSEYSISQLAIDMIKQKSFVLSNKVENIDLVAISAMKLGFHIGYFRYKNLLSIIKEFGLKPCPAEVGPQLRLQYKDQPYDESLHIVMDPIIDLNRDLRIFNVGNNGTNLWLGGEYGYPDNSWLGYFKFVFCIDN